MLTEEQILAAIDAAEAAAFGPKSSEIASDRADALDRYMGRPYGDELAGRSQVVSRDISDVVEGVAANVLKPFVGGDKIVMFNPRGPEDEEGAEQETDYVNFVVMERNNGFVVLNSAVKDALLLRNGYLKCGWAKRDDITIEKYEGLSEEELSLLAEDEDVEIVGHSEYPDPFGQVAAQTVPPNVMVPAQLPMLHDVQVHRKSPTEYVEVMPTPPDEIIVTQRSTEPSVQNADFVQHRTRKTLSELRELGYKIEDDILDDEDGSDSIEDQSRALFQSQSTGSLWDDPTADPARRIVLFKESWLRIDVNGDGIAELRRICQVGRNLLANEDADLIPIACFTPILMPHRHLGISVYDLVKDIAQIKTAMLRSHLDNRYLQNNAEKVVNTSAVENMDDFLVSRPGGVKRVRGNVGDAVMQLVVPDTGSGALMTLEYLDSIRENRTGYTKAAEGMKSGSLATDTLGELQQQVSQSGVRLEMIARTIAETGLRDLFRIVHALTLKHSSRAEKVRLRNDWVVINPREWVRRTDLSISVGLGSTTGPQQMQNLMMIGQAQQQAMPMGIVTPENVYNTLSKLSTAAGFKNPDEFFTKPAKKPKVDPQTGQPVMGPDGKPEMESAPPPQQPPPELQAAQAMAQGNVQKAQIDAQSKVQVEQVKYQLEPQKMAQESQIRIQEAEIKARVEIEKAHLQGQIELEKERIRAQAQVQSRAHDAALVRGATGTASEEVQQGHNSALSDIHQAVQQLAQLVAQMGQPKPPGRKRVTSSRGVTYDIQDMQ